MHVPAGEINLQRIFDYFGISVDHEKNKTKILMRFFGDSLYTSAFPSTYQTLLLNLPSIYKSKCCNRHNRKFAEEVKDTEIGHLFEHILIEYMCLLKFSKGYPKVVFSGITKWNWKRDPKGTFHIVIDGGEEHISIFDEALARSVVLLAKVLEANLRNQTETRKDVN